MQNTDLKPGLTVITWGMIFAGLYLCSLYSYLLYHAIVEMFSISIAFCIFMFIWNSRKLLNNNCLMFMGASYLFIGGLNLIHTLSYKGMGIFARYR